MRSRSALGASANKCLTDPRIRKSPAVLLVDWNGKTMPFIVLVDEDGKLSFDLDVDVRLHLQLDRYVRKH